MIITGLLAVFGLVMAAAVVVSLANMAWRNSDTKSYTRRHPAQPHPCQHCGSEYCSCNEQCGPTVYHGGTNCGVCIPSRQMITGKPSEAQDWQSFSEMQRQWAREDAAEARRVIDAVREWEPEREYVNTRSH